MKASTFLIAVALASPCALAQVSTVPPTASGATDITGTSGTSSGISSGDAAPGATNGMRAEAGADLQATPSPIARLKPVTHEDITYLCGGVGDEEAAYMKAEAKRYDMMLTFATRDGAYLADVDVDIKDAKGNSLLQTACDSPIMLVDLPRGGTYKVRAETAGYALNKTVRIASGKSGKGGRQQVASTVLSWPQQVAEAGIAPTSTGAGSGGTSASGNR